METTEAPRECEDGHQTSQPLIVAPPPQEEQAQLEGQLPGSETSGNGSCSGSEKDDTREEIPTESVAETSLHSAAGEIAKSAQLCQEELEDISELEPSSSSQTLSEKWKILPPIDEEETLREPSIDSPKARMLEEEAGQDQAAAGTTGSEKVGEQISVAQVRPAAAGRDNARSRSGEDSGPLLGIKRAMRICTELAEVVIKFAVRLEALESKVPTCYRETVKLARMTENITSDFLEREQKQNRQFDRMISDALKKDRARYQQGLEQLQANFDTMNKDLENLRLIIAATAGHDTTWSNHVSFQPVQANVDTDSVGGLMNSPRMPAGDDNDNNCDRQALSSWRSGLQWLEGQIVTGQRTNCWSEPCADMRPGEVVWTSDESMKEQSHPQIDIGSPRVSAPAAVTSRVQNTSGYIKRNLKDFEHANVIHMSGQTFTSV
jgi:hypothetical protein